MTNPRLRNPSAKKTEKNSRLRDTKITRIRDLEIHQKLFPGFEIGPKLRPSFFRLVRNASWRDRVTNAELYGDLPTLSDRIGFRRLGLTGHCHRPREFPPSQLVLWRPTHGHLGRHPGGYPPANPQPAWKIEWTERPFLYPYWWISICFVFLCFKTR